MTQVEFDKLIIRMHLNSTYGLLNPIGDEVMKGRNFIIESDDRTGIVAINILPIHESPRPDGVVLGILYAGDKVIITEACINKQDDEWYEVTIKGLRGYVRRQFINTVIIKEE